ncbi:hypothetical protein F9C07_5474 [Aspergillus flavus]|uniref:Uncharacterized protein n=1 Tax=Aspergillus flavus (strain ATCC 200026 / FGSC A1120 / IAM 13836 / NRRL 3357 / JCM 12722 / SRRC 167) TaxID=332952 RepID=A0A7U2MX01_ASPFN|nr:hypothetical protein F9C07_5474 [Aspergillus flavus]
MNYLMFLPLSYTTEYHQVGNGYLSLTDILGTLVPMLIVGTAIKYYRNKPLLNGKGPLNDLLSPTVYWAGKEMMLYKSYLIRLPHEYYIDQI